jgi:hypothetical protein
MTVSPRDIDQLTKIMRSLHSRFDGVRDAAASVFNTRLDTLELSITDLKLVLVNSNQPAADEFQSQIADAKLARRQVDRDNEALRVANANMLEFIEKKHGRAARRQFEREAVLREWPEFEELVRTRVYGGVLPAGWRGHIATHFAVAEARLERWRAGTAAIPPEIMQELSELPVVAIEQSQSQSPEQAERFRRKQSDRRLTSPEVVMEIARRLFSGARKSDIVQQLGVTKGQADVEWRPPPPGQITVAYDGPVDWFQIWEMENAISGARNWREKALQRLNLPNNFQYTQDLNAAVSPRLVERMRAAYFARTLLPMTPELQAYLDRVFAGPNPPMRSAQPVLDGILRAGPVGITIRRLAEVTGLNSHNISSRPIDLERQGLIRFFNSDDGKAYVATYWDNLPDITTE